jgi:hypothetical protein
MPPLPLVPDVIKAQVQWSDATDTSVTTTHYFEYSGTGPNATDAANLATVLSNAYGANVAAWSPRTITGVKVTDLATDTGGEGSATSDFVGTREGADLAGATAVVVNYALDRRYRGGKPRSYLPWGVTTDLSSRQSWASAFTTVVVAAVEGIMSAMVGTTEGGTTITNHANVSYYAGNTATIDPVTGRAKNRPKRRVDGPLVNPIVGVAVSVIPGSQRRRNR